MKIAYPAAAVLAATSVGAFGTVAEPARQPGDAWSAAAGDHIEKIQVALLLGGSRSIGQGIALELNVCRRSRSAITT